jgi:superfamily II DNA or RNA helicase
VRSSAACAAAGGFPAACIATYATAAVGVTLTAASRVYLFEPCTSPATEAQAAGRIHRLGQTKEIHIVRLAFRRSVEAALVEMHDARQKGHMNDATAEGRQALRAHFRTHGVDAAHAVAGPTEVTIVPIDARRPWDGKIRNTWQRCARCESKALVDSAKC